MLNLHIKGQLCKTVEQKDTAASVGSGLLAVFSTPSMIALMENTASQSIVPYLEEGMGTVGTLVHIRHLSATLVGQSVQCESDLIEIDGKRLVFQVQVSGENGIVGEGIHERFIINNEKFLAKLQHRQP